MSFASRFDPISLVWVAGLLAAVLAGAPAHAQPQSALHVDVSFQENESDGRLSIHGRDFDQLPANRIVPDQRVFGRSVLLAGNSLVQNDPGFTASDENAEIDPYGLDAPVGSENVWFNVLAAPPLLTELGGRNLSFWDGNNPVSWGPVPDDEGIQICNNLACDDEVVVADGATADVPGFVIDATEPSGGLHTHIKFLVLPDNGNLPPSGPDDGVYLMLMEGTLEPYAEWVPFYMMFEAFAGGSSTVQAAIADVEANFLLPLCSDGIDNDRDGLVDFGVDPGCEDGDDMSERGALAECDNGLDDDLNGAVDYPNDPGCVSALDTTEVPEPGATVALLSGWLFVGCLARRRCH